MQDSSEHEQASDEHEHHTSAHKHEPYRDEPGQPVPHEHEHEHSHAHEQGDQAHSQHTHEQTDKKNGHGHEHGKVDAELYGNQAGLRAVQISTFGMLLVSLIQLLIAFSGGSAGLFADALHNLGDVLTTVALWIAFVVSNKAANRRYTYGYHRTEDLAGIFIVVVIIASALAGAIESLLKLSSGNVPTQIYLSMAAAAIGCIGNEILAQYKISVGKRINSVPLIADGQHSRIDGLTSLAALLGLIGVRLGLPIADPLAGILITLVILGVVYTTVRSVSQRLLDAVDPRIVPAIIETTNRTPGVQATTDIRARWIGHTMHIILNIEVDAELTLLKAHEIAERVRHNLFHEIHGVSEVIVHTDPSSTSGDYHQEMAHHLPADQQSIIDHQH